MAPKDPTLISVCLLTYNHAPIVAEAIQTVLEQDLRHFELIISDDCSTDRTWDIVQSVAMSDPRVRALQTPRNLGMAGNANFAVAHSATPYVAILHHDDLCSASLLRRWLDVAERHPEVGFVSNGYEIFGTTNADICPFPECTDGRTVLEEYLLASLDCPFRGTALIRKSAWEAVGGMRERFGMLADVDLWMRLAARFHVGYIAEPLITVRQERPAYYPSEYSKWSWPRMRILYEIHAINHIENRTGSKLRDLAFWGRFRLRVSWETTYWLAYAIAKRRWDMLRTSSEVENDFEIRPARWLRKLLGRVASDFSMLS